MSSPIYAQSYIVEESDGEQGWIDIEHQYEDPRAWEGLLPSDSERYEMTPIGRQRP